MRNRRPRNSNVERLRLAIDCMPVATREAMLAGIQDSKRIIVGAYVDGSGGVCPMLAAHRMGARTDFLSFARSWDRFTRANGRMRVASEREVSILVAQLQDSLMSANGSKLDEAIKEHRALLRANRRPRMRRPRLLLPEQADPRGEIVARRLRKPALRLRAARRLTAAELLAAAARPRRDAADPRLVTSGPRA
jgi:hypothetical protein